MQKIYEDIKKVFESKTAVGVLYGIGVVIIALIIFSLGITVGFHKASFGSAWGDNYYRNFGMSHPDAGVLNPQTTGITDYFPNAHGVSGKIIKIELPNIIVEDKDNTEKAVLINPDTKIEQGRSTMTTADLKVDDFVVIIGNPDPQGIIEAKLLRVVPAPELLNN